MSIFDEIKCDIKNGTPGPWLGCNMVHDEGRPMTPEEIGEYVCNSVKMGEEGRFLFVSGKHDDGGVCDICHTGNGPKGMANTARIARVPDLERIALAAKDLADAVSRTGYATDNAGNTRLLDKDAMYSINDALKAFREATQ